MEGFKQLATNHPHVFALIVTLTLYLFATASFMLGMVIPAGGYKPHVGQIIGRLITILVFVFIIWRFGWLTSAGLTRIGGWQQWLVLLVLVVYVVAAALYAYFGNFKLSIASPKMAGVVALSQLTIGMVEETVYRGLVLYTFVRLWANTRWGLVASVLLSALFFGASHMVWVAFGKPVLQSTLLSLSAFESGVFYGAIVLASGSIWPAVILHGLVNAAVNVNLIGFPNYQETGNPDQVRK